MSTTSGISVGTNSISGPSLQDLEQVSAVSRLGERQRQGFQLSGRNVALAVGDLLRAADLQPLPGLDRLDEHGRLEQRLVGSRVEPGHTAPEQLDPQRAALEVLAVDVGDLELAARGRLEARSDIEHMVVVEVKTGHREEGFGGCGLLLDVERPPRIIELND